MAKRERYASQTQSPPSNLAKFNLGEVDSSVQTGLFRPLAESSLSPTGRPAEARSRLHSRRFEREHVTPIQLQVHSKQRVPVNADSLQAYSRPFTLKTDLFLDPAKSRTLAKVGFIQASWNCIEKLPSKALKLLIDRRILSNDISKFHPDSIKLVKKRLGLETQRAHERQLSIGERRQAFRSAFRRRKERNEELERKAGVVKLREGWETHQKEDLEVVMRLKAREPRRFKGSVLPTECSGLLTHTSTALYPRLFPSPTPQPSDPGTPDLFPVPEALRPLQRTKRDSRTVSMTPEPHLQTRLSVNLASPKSRMFVTSGNGGV